MGSALREIAISELEVGQPLKADIIDPSGRVLLKQGHILLPGVVERWVAHGFQKVLMPSEDEPQAPPLSPEDARLTRPYDPALVHEVETAVSQSKAAIEQMIVDLAVRSEPQLRVLESILSQIATALQTDSDVVLASAYREMDKPAQTDNERLIKRGVILSSLSSATAEQLELTNQDCLTIAMAGALHDLALFEETKAMILGDRPLPAEIEEAYTKHGDSSAELLGNSRHVSVQVRVIISQVHEQIDGSGFPKGLKGNVLSVHSRILNLVDAYLTLIDPQSSLSLVPADALAYLVRQTTRGAFDYNCMRALLKAISIYPVGSSVLLNNDRQAVVVRSSRSDPMRPIVRIDGADEGMIDLRHSELFISQPALNSEIPTRRRLKRSELDRILWQQH